MKMDIDTVYGSECLNYTNKPIGFASHCDITFGETIQYTTVHASTHIKKATNTRDLESIDTTTRTALQRWHHDTSKRKIGLVLGRSNEGGYEIAILGNETITNQNPQYTGGVDWVAIKFGCGNRIPYTLDFLTGKVTRDYMPSSYPTCSTNGWTMGGDGVPSYAIEKNNSLIEFANYDESLDFHPEWTYNTHATRFGDVWRFAGASTDSRDYTITNNKATTMVFGHRSTDMVEYPQLFEQNPLNFLSGNLYQWACDIAFEYIPFYPSTMDDSLMDMYDMPFKTIDVEIDIGDETRDLGGNLSSVPFNIILTNDENQAQKYLRDGTLPSDAFLFPLDFDNLPTYQSDDSSDEDEDDGQGDLDDDSRDCDSDLPEVPPYTPNSLNTNNVYLLTAGEVNQIINWLWNDVGSVQDLDDLVTKIQGLTSDLIQNFLMFRVMPVKPAWIGGAGSETNFVVGSVEKAGSYLNLAKGNAPIVNIGSYNFGNKFNTFKFLNYSPYSDFKLYLPYHGIVDIDVSVFQGHSLDVKAVYDYMTGTITYMIYCDNTWLVNTYTAKMAVDLSVSLQTKNDRDSAIFGNVSNAVAGVMSAGASVASGNPIGLVMGAQAIAQQTHSAPFKAMGQVGEMGAFYTPQRCKVLIRRPVPTTPETYNQNVGRQAYYSTTLAKLKGKGYTKCINPRLKFTKTIPLADEEEKINQLLSEGVYL